MNSETLDPKISTAARDNGGNIHIITGSTDPKGAALDIIADLKAEGFNRATVIKEKFPEVHVVLPVVDGPRFEKLWNERGGKIESFQKLYPGETPSGQSR